MSKFDLTSWVHGYVLGLTGRAFAVKPNAAMLAGWMMGLRVSEVRKKPAVYITGDADSLVYEFDESTLHLIVVDGDVAGDTFVLSGGNLRIYSTTGYCPNCGGVLSENESGNEFCERCGYESWVDYFQCDNCGGNYAYWVDEEEGTMGCISCDMGGYGGCPECGSPDYDGIYCGECGYHNPEVCPECDGTNFDGTTCPDCGYAADEDACPFCGSSDWEPYEAGGGYCHGCGQGLCPSCGCETWDGEYCSDPDCDFSREWNEVPCDVCGEYPCVCDGGEPCPECGENPCVCE